MEVELSGVEWTGVEGGQKEEEDRGGGGGDAPAATCSEL